jgi:hypothetical protein
MQSSIPRLLALFAVCGLFHSARSEQGYRLRLSAGDLERTHTVVSLVLPASAGAVNAVRDSSGKTVPLQVDERGLACFIEQSLPVGAAKTYDLVRSPGDPAPPSVRAQRQAGVVKIFAGQRTLLHFQAEKSELPRPNMRPSYRRGGYIHPVYTLSGRLVTDDYATNHLHQHGIWSAWTKTEFEGRSPDFWNMGQGKGTVEFAGLEGIWSGVVHAGFRSALRVVDLTAGAPKTVLNETWEVRIYPPVEGAKAYWLFDLVLTQSCARSSPLKLPEYYYGGMGLRGHEHWNGQTNIYFLTSEGITDRVQGNTTRGRWCYMGGGVEGAVAGLAVLGHPQNFRAPQPLRLHPKEPFFCYAPSQLGDWEITPEKPYVARYRYVVLDGPPDRDLLESLWQDYAHPPAVTLEKIEK